MQKQLVIYWVRRDFRLRDNGALYAALQHAEKNDLEFLPLFLLDPNLLEEDRWNIGYPRRWYLSRLLADFALKFETFDILVATPEEAFTELAKQFKLTVFVNSDIEPYARKRDAEIQKILLEHEGKLEAFQDQMTVDKNTLSGSGTIYSVYSPFRKKIEEEFYLAETTPKANPDNATYHEGLDYPAAQDSEASIRQIKYDNRASVETLAGEIFALIDTRWCLQVGDNKTINLDEILERPGIAAHWYLNEEQALEQFEKFNEEAILDYKRKRDHLGEDAQGGGATSRMSPALKWGLVTARTLKDLVLEKHNPKKSASVWHYLSELIWREFYRYILYHHPDVLYREFQDKYRGTIDWKEGTEARDLFLKWIKGETGYKVVDAAMHQIATEAWMHNRSRMMVASILTKNLGIDWKWGQEYFRAILVDLDEASNNGGWQWAASVGADPKPIRIFNPYSQESKYDPEGIYQQKHLPEDYDLEEPVIEHKQAREAALERYKVAKEKGVRDY